MSGHRPIVFRVWLIAPIVVILLAAAASAQVPPGGSKLWPWNVHGDKGFPPDMRNPVASARTQQPAETPRRYTMHVTRMEELRNEEHPSSALLVAHVPEGAQLWFDGEATTQPGTLRKFESPALQPGKEYAYAVRIAWMEEGRAVEQKQRVAIRAGEIYCINLIRTDSPEAESKIKESLAQLPPDDRERAEAQRVCIEQDHNRLGSMGVPVKVEIRGTPVFVCCESCVEKAKSNADATLTKLAELKSKTAPAVKH